MGVMQARERDLIDECVAALQSLPDVSQVTAEFEMRIGANFNWRVDASLSLHLLGRQARVFVEAKTYAYPRDLRDTANQILAYVSKADTQPIVPMIVADAISAGGMELLRREGIGYWDRSGSLYLKLPWAMFYVDRPRQRPVPPKLRSIYRGSAAQVLHTLLLEPAREWHVTELAAQSEVALSRAHTVISRLEQHLWVEKRGRGPQAVRTLVSPGSLLDSWAEAHTLREYSFHSFYGWSQSPAKLRSSVTAALDRHGIPYALTLTSGAELVAPFAVGHERLEILAQDYPVVEKAVLEAGLKRVDDGENMVFLLTKERSPFLFRQQIDGMQVASDVQLYLDLYASPRRGKEQAKHLRAERLSF